MAETSAIRSAPLARPVGPQLQWEIEQFLYAEAALLDARRFQDWLALMAHDLRYVMPTRYNRLKRQRDREFSEPEELNHFDEDYGSLRMRIKRIETGKAWAEEPPSRTRHLVTNVRITPADSEGEYDISCCFIVYRSRLEHQVDIFAGGREDRLRRTDGPAGFEIVRRRILLDQTVVMSNNLSIFF